MSAKRNMALPGSGAAFLIHWGVLSFLFPLLIILPNLSSGMRWTVVFPGVVILYSGTRLACIVASGANRVVEMTFWLYANVFLGLSAFLQTVANKFPWPGLYSTDVIVRAYMLVIAGMIAFDLGYRGHFARATRGATGHTERLRRSISRQRVYWVVLLGLLLSVFATYKLGLSTLFLDRTARFELIAQRYDTAWLTIYTAMAKTIPYVLLIALLAYRTREKRQRLIFTVLIVVTGLFALVENNPVATARFQVGTLLIGIYFVTRATPNKIRLAIYALLVGLVVVFPYADLFRTSNNASLTARIEYYAGRSPLATKVDYDSFQQIMNGLKMTDRSGFEYGHQLLGDVLFWVPRSVWVTKAEPTGQLIAKSSGYTFTNLSAPLWIELYVDGGWVLVLFGFALYGRTVRKLDDARRQSNDRSSMGYLFATIFAGYQIYLLRGSLLPAVAYLSPVIPILWLCTRRERHALPHTFGQAGKYRE